MLFAKESILSRLPLYLLSLFALLIVTLPVFGNDENSASVWGVGIRDADGSVLYSLLLETGSDALENAVISSRIPENATYVEALTSPETAVFAGEEGGIVNWLLDAAPAGSVIGPFTYRVTFAEGAEIPYRAAATLSVGAEQVRGEADDALLPTFSDTGSITVDANGTDGIVEVGETGVFMQVPEGAYSEPVTFTFERLPLTNETIAAEVAADTWWCLLFRVSVEPATAVAREPILIFYPTRRTLTPDLPAFGFTQVGDEAWQPIALNATAGALLMKPAPAQVNANIASVVSPSGNQIIAILIGVVPAPQFHYAAGVSVNARASGITDGTSNTRVVLELAGIRDGTSNIVDGTSNIIDGTSNTIRSTSLIGR